MSVVLGLAIAVVPAAAAKPLATAKKPPGVGFVSAEQVRAAIGAQRGRIVLLHLWATWCLPCLEELPTMGEFARAAKKRGVSVVSVSLDDPSDRAAEKVARVLAAKTGGAIESAILRTDDPQGFIHGVDPRWEGDIPALFVYDRQGNLRRAHVGEATREDLDKLVVGLDGNVAGK